MREQVCCSICGAVLEEGEVRVFGTQTMCEDCFEEYTTVCECCHERVWRSDTESDNYTTVCGACYDDYFTRCENCDTIIRREDAIYDIDDDYPYCDECYDKLDEKPIKPYNYKPEPIFYGSGDLFYGVELEIDKGGEYNASAECLMDIVNKDSVHMYCKHDGSINCGFEMVSHPMTLDYHLNNMSWLDVFNIAVSLGYRSHNTNTCGLHIHVSRSAFGDTHEKQEDAISRIVYFVEAHWNELLKFSRRTVGSIMHWASRYGIADTAKLTYDKAKKKCLNRYVAVNLNNTHTIEFRIFRGTLRYKTFIAALQLVDEICRLAVIYDDKTFEGMSWSDFVVSISKTDKPELIDYLKSKRLYVNEEITDGEEM